MNNTNQDPWQRLLAMSTPTFAGESSPPFGFVTNTLARLRRERGQVEEIERIGWRALLASLAVTVVAAAITFSVNQSSVNDLDPGERSMVQVQNISLS